MYFYSSWNGCLPIAGLPLAVNSSVPIDIPGWREALWELSVLPKNTNAVFWPGLEPRPLYLESSTLIIMPPHLPECKFIWVMDWAPIQFHFCYREAIQSLENENEELMKDNTLAGSMQNQNQVKSAFCFVLYLKKVRERNIVKWLLLCSWRSTKTVKEILHVRN